MDIIAYKLSSFAKDIYGGNPAGVVLNSGLLTEEQMMSLAKTVGYSETAFISKSDRADFKIRFFTPNSEVDLCGHATIAAFSLLKQKNIIGLGEYTQETKAGVLRISIHEDAIFMEQNRPQFFEIIPTAELCGCIGINSDEFDQTIPAQVVSTGIRDILVPVRDEETLRNLKPDMQEIEKISIKYNVTGLHVFAINHNSESTAVCRNFAPLYDIPEESATGTSNGALACYLYRYGRLNAPLDGINIEQGSFMNRPSIIKAMLKIKGREIKEVWVGGKALIIGEDSYQI
ncbi:MAG: PhzF family phenazine biosynthesis protein [Clostridia bacterium]|jgi:PhzF family phenazine biosynthesis protein|nr:PhzF family phenazine biosynthesis protein [Clostridia bacterium]